MPALDYLLDQHVLCRELEGAQPRTGLLKLTHHSIDTRFVAYCERLHIIETEHAIFLHTEHNDVVSLYGNISSGPGRRWKNSDVPLSIEFQEITSNLAIIGGAPWNECDHVVVATFDLQGTDRLFRNTAAREALSEARLEAVPREPLLTAAGPLYTVSIRHKFSYAFDIEAVSNIATFVHIQFAAPTSIFTYYDAVTCVAQFVACATGMTHPVGSIELYQSPWSAHDADPSTHPASYIAHYLRGSDYLAEQKEPTGTSVWHAHRSDDLNVLQRALTEWIGRYDQWRAATAMMMGAIYFRTVLSSDRIVNACRWLENLPNAKSLPSIDATSIEKISVAARERATELGYTNLGPRIDGALTRIGTETHAERFKRLVGSLNKCFGGPIAGDRLVDDLSMALKFRNRCAHGNFLPASDKEQSAFLRSTLAMEAFCFLMTLKDLPLDPVQAHRIGNHRIVRDYRLCP